MPGQRREYNRSEPKASHDRSRHSLPARKGRPLQTRVGRAGITQLVGSESQMHLSGTVSTQNHLAASVQRHLSVGSLGLGSCRVATWSWSSRQRCRWRACGQDEATVSGAANINSSPSGSHGTEATGSSLRSTPARDHQHGTAHRRKPANGLAAAPTQQPAA
jgi:hypothetical protein